MRRIVERRLLDAATRLLGSARVLVVNGPRQAGKSWLLRRLAADRPGTYLTLDERADLRGARVDPSGFVARDPGSTLFVDEVQRGGDALVLAVKAAVDRSDERGQYVLAGSTRFLTEPRLSESLAGRARFLDLWPLTQGEIDGLSAGDSFLDGLTAGIDALFERGRAAPTLDRRDAFDRVLRGGFPETALDDDSRARAEFFASYVRTVSQRDIAELGRITQRVDLPSVLRLLAARSATILNVSDVANDAGLGRETARRYLPLIEAIFLSVLVPGWSRSPTTRSKARPKIYLSDSGLMGWVTRVRPEQLRRPGNPLDGQLLETFVVNELLRQTGWSSQQMSLAHWHDHLGREVDVIVETGTSTIAGIEVKAAIDVDDSDFRHLAYLRDRVGSDFEMGVVFHLGDRPRRFGDRLISLPLATLWSAP